MTRLARIVIPGVPHHVTQRGVRSMNLFASANDFKKYLQFLKDQSEKSGLEVLSYCLMNNHVHLLVIPETEESLRRGIGETHRRFTRFINLREGVNGHLFQERFFSCPLDQAHLIATARYIERNPVKAGMCKTATDYPHSSARFHTGIIQKDVIVQKRWFGTPSDWIELLKEDPAELEMLKKHFKIGRPLGSPSFIQQLEEQTGRTLTKKNVGRPQNKENTKIN